MAHSDAVKMQRSVAKTMKLILSAVLKKTIIRKAFDYTSTRSFDIASALSARPVSSVTSQSSGHIYPQGIQEFRWDSLRPPPPLVALQNHLPLLDWLYQAESVSPTADFEIV
jgi:hypothetical protein